jgi:CRP-like cAMP-binding protein
MLDEQISNAWKAGTKCEKCAIRNMVLFADLTREDFDLMHRPIHDFELRAGETLYNVEADPTHIFTLRSGLIKLISYLPDGSHRIVRIIKQGDVVGLEAMGGKPYLHHAVVLEVATLCKIPVSLIDTLNENSPHLSEQLMLRWQQVISDADIWLSQLSVGLANQRVASLLLYLAEGDNKDKCYLPSREDMGATLAISPETASRVVASFKREGWVKSTSPYRVSLNPGALAGLLENKKDLIL